MNKAVFLDRDGVLNEERGDYSWLPEHMVIPADLKEGLEKLKESGFLLIVITNQGGIAKGLYSAAEVINCFKIIQKSVDEMLDDQYYSPYHQITTKSLSRKPESLMLERAMAKYKIDPGESWMIGDSQRDIDAAKNVGVKGVLISANSGNGENTVSDFTGAVKKILSNSGN